MTLVELIRGLKGRKEAAVENYAAAVQRVADDGNVLLEALEQCLASAGKTPEDFEADVQRLRRRREAAQQIRDAEECPLTRQNITRQFAVARSVLDKAEAEYHAVARGLERELDGVRHLEQTASDARRLLESTAGPEARQKVKQAADNLHQASCHHTECRDDRERLTHAVRYAEQQLADVKANRVMRVAKDGYIGPEVTVSTCQERLNKLRQELAGAEAKCKEAQQAYDKATQELEQTQKLLLIP